jgi:hypothetical protein
MKHIITLIVILLAATVLGCNDAPAPKNDVRVESASEAARNDNRAIAARLAEQKAALEESSQLERARNERQQNVELLSALSKRWAGAVAETSRTGRSDLTEPIKKLQAIKAEADTIAVDECTGKARATLVASMSAAIAAYGTFQKETGDGSEASKQQLESAGSLLLTSQTDLNACRMQ